MNKLWFNHLKIAVRSIQKHRLSAIINIAGLAVGMASCLLLTLYVEREMSYDRFYKEADQVYRLTTYWKQEESEEHFATTAPPLGPMLADISPEVIGFTRMSKRSDFTMRPDHDFERPYRETNAWTVDKDFVKVLNAGVLAGDPILGFTKAKTKLAKAKPKTTALSQVLMLERSGLKRSRSSGLAKRCCAFLRQYSTPRSNSSNTGITARK